MVLPVTELDGSPVGVQSVAGKIPVGVHDNPSLCSNAPVCKHYCIILLLDGGDTLLLLRRVDDCVFSPVSCGGLCTHM